MAAATLGPVTCPLRPHSRWVDKRNSSRRNHHKSRFRSHSLSGLDALGLWVCVMACQVQKQTGLAGVRMAGKQAPRVIMRDHEREKREDNKHPTSQSHWEPT